ncbi:UNVERIFIED_CONTAM: hypothetical protein HHA_204055 [Hammondia hammondi]|eukprot:XP_008884686.1 hypothetical protein HHA_204055 [Hammondia hammondi]
MFRRHSSGWTALVLHAVERFLAETKRLQRGCVFGILLSLPSSLGVLGCLCSWSPYIEFPGKFFSESRQSATDGHPRQWQCQAKCKPANGVRVVRHYWNGTNLRVKATRFFPGKQCEEQRHSPQISVLYPKSGNISYVGRESAGPYMFPVLHSCRLSDSNTAIASYVSSTTRSDLWRSSRMVQERVSLKRFLSQELPIQSQVQPFLNTIAGGVSLPG